MLSTGVAPVVALDPSDSFCARRLQSESSGWPAASWAFGAVCSASCVVSFSLVSFLGLMSVLSGAFVLVAFLGDLLRGYWVSCRLVVVWSPVGFSWLSWPLVVG